MFFDEGRALNSSTPAWQVPPSAPFAADPSRWQPLLAAVQRHEQERGNTFIPDHATETYYPRLGVEMRRIRLQRGLEDAAMDLALEATRGWSWAADPDSGAERTFCYMEWPVIRNTLEFYLKINSKCAGRVTYDAEAACRLSMRGG